MIGEPELIGMIGPLDAAALQRWIDLGWVLPGDENGTLRFDASDVIRVRLICELHYDLSIDEDSMAVVLSLIDQLYAARRSLRILVSAVEAQPESVRAGIATFVTDRA
jgi:chaperone modulatory protein CbpM